MIAHFKSKEFLSFIVAGGIAAMVNFGSRFFYSEFVTFGTAVILAYLTGMVTAFILTKHFVFEESRHATHKEFLYFTLVNVVAIIQTYIISVGLAHYIFPHIGFDFYTEAIAHALGVAFPVFTSFIGHKYFSFKSENSVLKDK
jgi:putative flippase GtrA